MPKTTVHPWEGFDPLIHEMVRFVTLETLCKHGELRYSDMLKIMKKEIPRLTNGNFTSHLSKLEETGYVKANRYFEGRDAVTEYAITDDGRRSFEAYLIGTLNRLNLSFELTGIKKPM